MNIRSVMVFAAVGAALLGTGDAGFGQATSAAPASALPVTPSGLLRPALDGVAASLAGLSADRWRLPKDLRAATNADIDSIRRDLDQILPALLTTADAVPDAVSTQLPVAGNVGALYDVMLRVTERAKMAAPSPTPDQLIHSLTSLEAARRALADHITQDAAAQERRVVQLQTSLNARPAVPATPATASKPCVAPPKPKRQAKARTAARSTAARPQ